MLIDQQAHQLGDGQYRMRIVEVNGHMVRQLVETAVRAQIAVDQVLQAGSTEKIFLSQAQLAPGQRGVVRIQHPRHVFRMVLVFDRRHVVALIKSGQIDFAAGLGRPEPQRVGRFGGVTGNDGVVRHGQHILGIKPAHGLAVLLEAAAETHPVLHFRTRKLPRITARQPVIRNLDLMAVDDLLFEHAVVVADAVTEPGQAERGHRVEKTGGKPAQAAIAEGGIMFKVDQLVEIDVHLGQRLLYILVNIERQQCIGKRAPDQKLHRQVIHPLDVLLVLGAGGFHPALHQPIAHGQGGCLQPVLRLGCYRIFANRVNEFVGNRQLEMGDIVCQIVVLKISQVHCVVSFEK